MEDRLGNAVIDGEEIPELSPSQRENLLRRSWMANDGLWFYQAFANYGPDAANNLNVTVVREFGRLEMRRLLRALGVTEITSLAQYRQVFQIAVDLYVGDLFRYEQSFEGRTHHIRVKSCFAYSGVARAGVAKVYHCGPFERVVGWFEALKLPVKITPDVGACQMAHVGQCAYSLAIELPEDAGSADFAGVSAPTEIMEGRHEH